MNRLRLFYASAYLVVGCIGWIAAVLVSDPFAQILILLGSLGLWLMLALAQRAEGRCR